MKKGFIIQKTSEEGTTYYCNRNGIIPEFTRVRDFAHVFKKKAEADSYAGELCFLTTGDFAVIEAA